MNKITQMIGSVEEFGFLLEAEDVPFLGVKLGGIIEDGEAAEPHYLVMAARLREDGLVEVDAARVFSVVLFPMIAQHAFLACNGVARPSDCGYNVVFPAGGDIVEGEGHVSISLPEVTFVIFYCPYGRMIVEKWQPSSEAHFNAYADAAKGRLLPARWWFGWSLR